MNPQTVILELHNNRTSILKATPQLLKSIGKHLRYPTDIALAKQEGWIPPDEDPEKTKWDGWIRFLAVPKYKPPHIPSGLVPEVERCLDYWGVPHQLEDCRERPQEGLPEFPKVQLRDYQEQAVQRAVELGRGVFDMVPRSGKTRTGIELQRRLAQPCLWIAPTDRIVTQTREVFDECLGENYAVHVVGTKSLEKAMKARVVLCTMATAVMLPDELYDTRRMLVVDEWHHGASVTGKEIFKKASNIYYRYGMTGTFFRSGEDVMAMHALLSRVIYKVTARDMLDMGYLVPTKVAYMPVATDPLPKSMSNFITGHGKHGIHENAERNWLCAWSALQLHASGKKVLVLVGTKRQGRFILDYVAQHQRHRDDTEFQTCEFVSTDTRRQRINRILKAFLSSDEVGILIGTSLLGEGVDLPVADALVYARGEKAEVSLVQNLYRVGTACPGKTEALIVDFSDRHHRKLLAHSQERARVCWEEDTFNPVVLASPGDLFSWGGLKNSELRRYR